MKKFLLLVVCAILAAGTADARTLYVNCKRPNNNGNGLKPATAKRTIQAAINLAKDGDTILVYPGNYADIGTHNKKIAIKSLKGASKTKILRSPKYYYWTTLASLGKGKNTLLSGFLLDGRKDYWTVFVRGGRLKACILQGIYGSGEVGVYHATLTDCTFRNNGDSGIKNSILDRCKILGNKYVWIDGSRLCNCLVVGNEGWGRDFDNHRSIWPSLFYSSILVNCTIVKNCTWHDPNNEKYGPDEKPVFAYKSRFYNCILRGNYSRTVTWKDNRRVYGKAVVHNADTAKVYQNTYSHTYTDNRNPKFADAANNNYRLAKDSPCIDRGVINATLKKWLGALDLRGRQRVKGKAIDMGCYEY